MTWEPCPSPITIWAITIWAITIWVRSSVAQWAQSTSSPQGGLHGLILPFMVSLSELMLECETLVTISLSLIPLLPTTRRLAAQPVLRPETVLPLFLWLCGSCCWRSSGWCCRWACRGTPSLTPCSGMWWWVHEHHLAVSWRWCRRKRLPLISCYLPPCHASWPRRCRASRICLLYAFVKHDALGGDAGITQHAVVRQAAPDFEGDAAVAGGRSCTAPGPGDVGPDFAATDDVVAPADSAVAIVRFEEAGMSMLPPPLKNPGYNVCWLYVLTHASLSGVVNLAGTSREELGMELLSRLHIQN